MAKRVARRDIPDALRVEPGKRERLPDERADRVLGWARDDAEAALDCSTSSNSCRYGFRSRLTIRSAFESDEV